MLKNISPGEAEEKKEIQDSEEKKEEGPLNREKSTENKSKFFEMLRQISPERDENEKKQKHKFLLNQDL